MQYPKLSKSKIQTGINCPKALWLDKYKKSDKRPYTKDELYRFAQGTRVGELAAITLYPKGIKIEGGWRNPNKAVETTLSLINIGRKELFEAAFISDDNVIVLVDILQIHEDNSITINEVKSSTSVKPEHINDVYIQKYVLEKLGYDVKTVNIIHLNSKIDIVQDKDLFVIADVTKEVDSVLIDLPDIIGEFSIILDNDDEPVINIGNHCSKPYKCSFYEYCWDHVPQNSIYTIPRIHYKKIDKLEKLGIIAVNEIPNWFSLTDIQSEYVDLVKSDKPIIRKKSITNYLSEIKYPLYFLDFETYMVALPIIDTKIPYKNIPFQFSCHILDSDGNLIHKEYIHDGSDNKVSEGFLKNLFDVIGTRGTIISYNIGFEKMILNQLRKNIPGNEEKIDNAIDRFWDLEPLFNKYFLHPKFNGKSSLKIVLPVLIPSMSYKELELSQGSQAGIVWEEMLKSNNEEEINKLRENLFEYCKTDTLAMVKLFDLIQRVASEK